MDFTLPKSSLSMEEGKVAKWLVPDGATVAAGQAVVEIETDKSVEELEAPAAGTLRIVAAEGAVVPVDSVLATIGVDSNGAAPAPAAAASAGGRLASPAVRRMAAERGIDLGRVTGTGPDGRITAADLDAADVRAADVRAAAVQAAAPPDAAPPAAGEFVSPAPAPSLREAVVKAITASWQQVPHIHIGGELDVSGLAAARRTVPPGVTVTDLLVAAVGRALRDVPELNGLNGARSAAVHLALAVASPDGVVSPVIRDVDRLTIEEIAAERARLVDAARRSASDRRDLGGATCTLSNLGAHPVDFFAPVVSGPQTAMVATGRMAEKPVALDGGLAVRSRMWVNVAIDHRHADGEAGGRFLSALQRHLNS